MPPGVINVVSGGDELGAWMTGHPVPRKVSFTGSIETGKKVAMSAAPDLKRVTLELGGNDPAIVLDDADPAVVSKAIFAGAFNNNGQVCSAIKRVYVPESMYDDVVDGLAAQAAAVKVGDGTEEGSKLGPINNKPQFERVKELVGDALSHGATAAVGGHAMDRPGLLLRADHPVRAVSDGTRIVDEEQFGPALPVISYRDVDDVVERANATHFGLSGSVWGTDTDRASEVAGQARVRDGLGEHPPGPRPPAAVRRLQVERGRRRERALGPGRVQRDPGHAPLQERRRAQPQHRRARLLTARGCGRRQRAGARPAQVVCFGGQPRAGPGQGIAGAWHCFPARAQPSAAVVTVARGHGGQPPEPGSTTVRTVIGPAD